MKPERKEIEKITAKYKGLTPADEQKLISEIEKMCEDSYNEAMDEQDDFVK